MPDYFSVKAPWYDNREEIKKVVITDGVTNIGNMLSMTASSLTSVTIPNSVTSIGYHAFYGCSGLTSITIPNSVTSIGDFAFKSCSGLTSITIPNSVTSIGYYAFDSCSGLTSITVEKGNTKYDSRDNCNAIIETNTNKLIAGCKNTIIPNSVTSIGNYAFSGCSGLTSITIPNSVTSIGVGFFIAQPPPPSELFNEYRRVCFRKLLCSHLYHDSQFCNEYWRCFLCCVKSHLNQLLREVHLLSLGNDVFDMSINPSPYMFLLIA